jgi:hypothetical protein
LKQFEDYIELLFSLLGGSVDVAVSAVDKYLWIVGKAFRISIIALVGVVAFVLLSGLTGASAFLALAVVLAGVVIAAWSVLVFPMVLIVELGAQWEPVRRQLRTLGFVIVATAAFAFLALRLPGGFGGASILVSLFVLFLGLAAFGFRPTRTTLGMQMILTAVFSIFAVIFPQTSGLLGSVAGALDTEVSRRLSPNPTELEMSMSVLTGQGGNVPALFKLHDGSPNWWCRPETVNEAGYRCFGQPGRDQTTQKELLPITPELVQAAISNLQMVENTRLQEAELREQVRRAEEAERVRLDAERQAAEKAERKRQEIAAEEVKRQRQEEDARRLAEEAERARVAYIEKYVAGPAVSEAPVWSIFGDQPRVASDLDRLLRGVVANYRPFLHNAALTDGVFDRLIAGNTDEIDRLDLSQLAPAFILGRMSERTEALDALQGGQKSSLTLSLSVVGTNGQGVLHSQVLSAEALGQNENIARDRSLERLNEQLLEFIQNTVETLDL